MPSCIFLPPTLAWVIVSSLVLPTAAQEPEDFATGLKLLRQLGIPSTEGARWARAGDDQQSAYTRTFGDFEIELKGAGWALPGEKFLPPAGLEVTDQQTQGAEEEPGVVASVLEKMLKAHQEKNPEDKPAQVPEKKPDDGADLLEKDVKALIETLQDSDQAESIRRNLEYGRGDEVGRVLIFAAQIDQAGHPQLAHDLISALFNASQNRDAVIDFAITLIANHEYERIWSRFQEDHQWQTYHRELLALMEKFPRGWTSRAAAAMLLPALEKRASGAPVPAIDLPGTPLAPEAVQILARLHDTPPKAATGEIPEGLDLSRIPVELRAQILSNYSGSSSFDAASLGIWLLPEIEGEEQQAARDGDDPRFAIIRIGVDAIPALAALLGDPTLTYFPNDGDSGGHYFSSSEDAMSRNLRLYDSMNRPKSRGEIALSLLAPIIPSEDEDFDSSANPDPEALRQAALEFWKKHRDSSPVEICKEYLSTGNSNQKYSAGQFLASSSDPNAAAAFESAVLDSSDPIELLSLVEVYLGKRKAAGRPFFDKFSKLLGELDHLDESDLPWQLRQAGGLEGTIRKLGILVGASSVKELIESALQSDEAKESPDEMVRSLATNLRSIPVADVIQPMAKALTSAPEEHRFHLIQAFVSGLWSNSTRGDSPPEFDESARSAWTALLENETPLNPDNDTPWLDYYEVDRMSSAAAFIVELIADPTLANSFRIHRSAHDGDSGDILMRRARARLAGEEVPAYTSSEGIDKKRIEEIQNLADTTSTPLDLAAAVQALSPPEKAAWIEGFSRWSEEESPVPPTLLAARVLVTNLTEPDAEKPLPADILEKLSIQPGRKIDLSLFEQGCRTLLENAGSWSGSVIDINSNPVGTGLKAGGTRHGDEESLALLADHDAVIDSDADAFAMGYCYDSDEALIWSIKDGKVELLTELDEDDRNPIAHILGQIESSKGLFFPDSQLMVLQREDLAKYQTPDE